MGTALTAGAYQSSLQYGTGTLDSGPPSTVSSTDAVSGLRIRYFTLQLLLLLLLLRLPLQVSLERNYSYYYSVPPRPISRTRLGLYTLPYRFWSVKESRRWYHSSSYLPTAASPRRPARPYTLSLSMRYTCCSARE